MVGVRVVSRKVVRVDDKGMRLGLVDIWDAHKGEGTKHLAVSVLLHDGGGRVLLQKRSSKKPLWPLVWSNTVCTHPFDGEGGLECAVRRLKEEVGIKMVVEGLEEVYKLSYEAKYSHELSENEVTTVVLGRYGGGFDLNSDEVVEARWVKWKVLEEEIVNDPDAFSPWFRMMVEDGGVNEKVVVGE